MAESTSPVAASSSHGPVPPEPVSEKVLRIVYAVGILFPVLAFGIGRAFAAPIKDGPAAQLAYSAAHPALHQVELIVLPLVCVLSLLGIIGLARLAIHRSPWFAMTGGALALAGWGTLPIWAGQDNLTYLMGQIGSTRQLDALWTQFNTSGTNTYLYIFIIGHLFGPLLLAIGLVRARVIPRWSPILIGISIPLHIFAFATGVWYVDPIAYAMLAVALIPAVVATLRARVDAKAPVRPVTSSPGQPVTVAVASPEHTCIGPVLSAATKALVVVLQTSSGVRASWRSRAGRPRTSRRATPRACQPGHPRRLTATQSRARARAAPRPAVIWDLRGAVPDVVLDAPDGALDG